MEYFREKNVHIIKDDTPWECFAKFEIYARFSRLSDSRSIYIKTVQVDIEFFPGLPMSFLSFSFPLGPKHRASSPVAGISHPV